MVSSIDIEGSALLLLCIPTQGAVYKGDANNSDMYAREMLFRRPESSAWVGNSLGFDFLKVIKRQYEAYVP